MGLKSYLRPFYRPFQPIYAPVFNSLRRRYRRARLVRRETHRLRQEIAATIEAQRPIKLILGAGGTRYAGWIHTDIPYFDMLEPAHWTRVLRGTTVDNLLLEHVVEHIPQAAFVDALGIMRQHLAPDGVVRVAVPDGYHPDPRYIDFVRPGGIGPGCDDHDELYTVDALVAVLQAAGWRVTPLEYYDEAGTFHQQARDPQHGPIVRDKDFTTPDDPTLDYSSLIVDARLMHR